VAVDAIQGPLRVRLLGELEVAFAGGPVVIAGVQRQALLALLALRAPHPVSREALIDALWGEEPPLTAVNAVQVQVSALRRALGRDSLQTAAGGYRLAVATELDVRSFRTLRDEGLQLLAAGEATRASDALRAGLALWRGAALAGLGSIPFVAPLATQLEEERLAALERRLEADLAAGRHRDVVTELESVVGQHPLREGLRGLLMQALYRGGRQADALAVYEQGRRLLGEELGIDPSPALRELHRRLLQQDDEAPMVEPASTSSASVVPAPLRRGGRLPRFADPTVAREADIEALTRMLRDEGGRLVSVLGAGGVGKTRVAVEVARVFAEEDPDAVVYVPVADAAEPNDLPSVICQALEVPASEDAAVACERALSVRHGLVVLDNLEHVIKAAVLVAELAAAAQGCRFLVTSRQALEVRAERRYVLAPLETDGERGTPGALPPATQLFLSRVRSLDPSFEPGPDELADIATICERCDGLPLAVELAAARTRALTLVELREELARSLGVLTSRVRDVPERQRTLRASIAWSVGSLGSDEAAFLAQLSVFRGGFTTAASAAVVGCTRDEAVTVLEVLLDRCLLRSEPGSVQGRRFALYETVREYVAELLGVDEARLTRRRHATHMRALLDPPPFPAQRPQTAAGWQLLLDERANLRQAVRWALDADDGVLAAELVVGVAGLWIGLGPFEEYQSWLERLLARQDVPAGRRCDALYWVSVLRDQRGQPHGNEATEALELAGRIGDAHRRGWALLPLAWDAALRGERDEADRLNDELRSIAHGHPDAVDLQITSRLADCWAAFARGAIEDAIGSTRTALDLARAHQHDLRSLLLLNNLSEFHLLRGEASLALAAAEEGVANAAGFPGIDSRSDLLSQRGYAHLLLGEVERAVPDLRAALEGHLGQGAIQYALADLLRWAAAIAVQAPEVAATALGVYDAAREYTEQQGHLQTRTLLQDLPARLGEARYAEVVRQGELSVARLGGTGAVHALLNRDRGPAGAAEP
jgi:predicted ATPase/DNA-binding SARP family transcriptional activator